MVSTVEFFPAWGLVKTMIESKFYLYALDLVGHPQGVTRYSCQRLCIHSSGRQQDVQLCHSLEGLINIFGSDTERRRNINKRGEGPLSHVFYTA